MDRYNNATEKRHVVLLRDARTGLDADTDGRFLPRLGKEGVMRVCKRCDETKPLDRFPINNTLPSGVLRKHTCNDCRSHQGKVRARLHRENTKPTDATCPICKRSGGKIVLDHDHDTDEFRGWLCNDCNNALGKFGDSIDMLRRAINYLKG